MGSVVLNRSLILVMSVYIKHYFPLFKFRAIVIIIHNCNLLFKRRENDELFLFAELKIQRNIPTFTDSFTETYTILNY